MMRFSRLVSLAAMVCITAFLPGVSFASLPSNGFTADYFTVRERIACDTLEQLKVLYEVGKDNVFLIRPKMDDMARERNAIGEPVCVVAKYPNVVVVETQYLGPIVNLVGDFPLGLYASHVIAPHGYHFWVLIVEAQDAQPAPVSIPDTGRDGPYRYILFEPEPSWFEWFI